MRLFPKKYDLEKDRLRIIFNPNEQKYNLYYGDKIIPIKELNFRTNKILKKKNKSLITNPSILKKELDTLKHKQRFKKLKSMGYTCDNFQYLGKIKGTMSKEMEEFLDALTSEENILLGIHRVKYYIPMEQIEDILTNGLKMTGHQDGAVPTTNNFQNNVSIYTDNKIIIKELMYANEFKNSKGSILIRIPDEDLHGYIYITDKDGGIRLNPKYIIGYVPLYNNNHLENIILPPNKSNQNTYSYSTSIQENDLYDNTQISKNSKHR